MGLLCSKGTEENDKFSAAAVQFEKGAKGDGKRGSSSARPDTPHPGQDIAGPKPQAFDFAKYRDDHVPPSPSSEREANRSPIVRDPSVSIRLSSTPADRKSSVSTTKKVVMVDKFNRIQCEVNLSSESTSAPPSLDNVVQILFPSSKARKLKHLRRSNGDILASTMTVTELYDKVTLNEILDVEWGLAL